MASDAEQEVADALNKNFLRYIASGREIATDAINNAIKGRDSDPEWIKDNFSYLVEKIQLDAYALYLAAEGKAWRETLPIVFGPMIAKYTEPKQMLEVIGGNFYALDKFFLSRTQSRRSRAGIAFEELLHVFFTLLEYPFEPQPKIDGNPDFVFPSVEHYRKNAQDAIVFTAKRTLRERWRQIVTEGAKGLGFFLATIDDKVSETDLESMRDSRISLVVPKRIKEETSLYKQAHNVMSFEDFFIDHLDPAIAKWRRKGII